MKKTSGLLGLLREPQYLENYAKYKAQVEHKEIPTQLLNDLPFDLKIELLEAWNKAFKERKR